MEDVRNLLAASDDEVLAATDADGAEDTELTSTYVVSTIDDA
jgi:hypothetical protein